MTTTVSSPLTGSTDVTQVQSLDPATIIGRYRDQLGMDVSPYFRGLSEVPIYRCNRSQLRFYYPFTLAGDGAFYAELSRQYKGYYSPWKWEHEQVYRRIGAGQQVLEIGSGSGYFLKRLPERGATGLGLELNDAAIEAGAKLGVTIRNEALETHAAAQAGQYDWVCAFQVFEHVNEVGAFFRQAIECLRPGGFLAVGGPNNEAYFFREDPYHTLNLPPHHMLLWDPVSLRYAGEALGLRVTDLLIEPASANHRSQSYRIWLEKYLGRGAATALHPLTRFLVKPLPLFTTGGTVVAIYQKS